MAKQVALELQDLWAKYPKGGWVLKGLNLKVCEGDVVLIVGTTGSGKTTLARVLNGTAQPVYGVEVRGVYRIRGENALLKNPFELSKRVHVVSQNPYLHFINFILEDDLKDYIRKIHGDGVAERFLEKILTTFHLNELRNRYFYQLSGGQARRAATAKAFIPDPQVLVFDEPFMWLDDKGVNEFLDMLNLLRRLGKTIVVFEHRFQRVARFFDKFYVLKQGVLEEADFQALYQSVKDKATSLNPSIPTSPTPGEVLVDLEDLAFGYEGELLRNIRLTIRRGEGVLITGSNGAGKSTLLKIISGYLKPWSGRVRVKGRIIYVPQQVALFYTEETLRDEVLRLCQASGGGERCMGRAVSALEEAGLDPSRPPSQLSYGQMVKAAVILAAWAGSADILLLDEPFSGLTYVDRARLISLLSSLPAAKILTTSTMELTSLMRNWRILMLENGELKTPEKAEKEVDALVSIELARRLLGDAA